MSPANMVAKRRSVDGEKDAYLGAQALVNINNPKVGDNQYSTAQIWVEGGPSDHVSTLQAGWAVSPQLLGDNQTRLFVNSNDDVTQHWWLGIGPNPNEVTWVGYWPTWWFPNLKTGAKNIAWGGLVSLFLDQDHDMNCLNFFVI